MPRAWVMVQLRCTLIAALSRICAFAYAEDRRISEVAADIVERRICLDQDQT